MLVANGNQQSIAYGSILISVSDFYACTRAVFQYASKVSTLKMFIVS